MMKNFYILFNTSHPTLHIIMIIIMMCNVGCYTRQYHTYTCTNTKQGIYLNQQDIQKKIHIGITKSEIISNIGLPTLQNIFGLNKWYYIYCHDNPTGYLEYKTIELEFDSNDILTIIKIL